MNFDFNSYRLTNEQKSEIAKNLIDILEKDEEIKTITKNFIYTWITTSGKDKRKAHYDVWDIVLRNYLPSERPIIFRFCKRIGKNLKITSFSGSIYSAIEFSKNSGSNSGNLIICDTNEILDKLGLPFSKGAYENTFYQLFRICNSEASSSEFAIRKPYRRVCDPDLTL